MTIIECLLLTNVVMFTGVYFCLKHINKKPDSKPTDHRYKKF